MCCTYVSWLCTHIHIQYICALKRFHYVLILTCTGTRLTSSTQIVRDSKVYTTISKSNSIVDGLSSTIWCSIARWYCNTYVYIYIKVITTICTYIYILHTCIRTYNYFMYIRMYLHTVSFKVF